MRLFLFFGLLCVLFMSPAAAQIEGFQCPRVDCQGGCGRFYDSNGDGFCDYGQLTKIDTPDPVVVNPVVTHPNAVKGNNTNMDSLKTDSLQVQSADSVKTTKTKPAQPVTERRPYSLIIISLLCFGLYGFTSLLHELKLIRKFVHRRIWNVLLLITFLTSAVLGVILVIHINYNLQTKLILDYLYWHVQFGIAMAVIAFIHVLWHWKYFRNLFAKKNKSDCTNA